MQLRNKGFVKTNLIEAKESYNEEYTKSDYSPKRRKSLNIYAAHAATTRMSRTAIDAMLPCLTEMYGNPSSLYTLGQQAKELLEKAREEVAGVINADPREITFTSGGSRGSSFPPAVAKET